MSRLRAPAMTELVIMLRDEQEGPRRAQLEEWYWALAVEEYGPVRAGWYRDEYRWLRGRLSRTRHLTEAAA